MVLTLARRGLASGPYLGRAEPGNISLLENRRASCGVGGLIHDDRSSQIRIWQLGVVLAWAEWSLASGPYLASRSLAKGPYLSETEPGYRSLLEHRRVSCGVGGLIYDDGSSRTGVEEIYPYEIRLNNSSLKA